MNSNIDLLVIILFSVSLSVGFISAAYTRPILALPIGSIDFNELYKLPGFNGLQGPKGEKGDIGRQGPPGPRGQQGPKGDTGETGATGAAGPQGPKEDTAEQGPQGESEPVRDLSIRPVRGYIAYDSSGTVYSSLQRAIEVLVHAVPGLLIGYRVISQGDELALLPEEMASLSLLALERRRASGAARRVARELMKSLGLAGLPIIRSAFGSPIWPAGVVGSMAHDDRFAVAAVGLRRDLDAVGIDIEPIVPLPPDMLNLIATPWERRAIADKPLGTNLLFAIKEAVYKAAYPLDHEFLDFHDIEVDLAGRIATTRTGRTLTLHWCVFSHVLVIATVQKAPLDRLHSIWNWGRSI